MRSYPKPRPTTCCRRHRPSHDVNIRSSHPDLGALDRQVKAASTTSHAPNHFADILRPPVILSRSNAPPCAPRTTVSLTVLSELTLTMTTDDSGLLWAYRPVLAWRNALHIFLRYHFSNTLYGAALRSRAPPIEWLTKGLATKGTGPTVDSKYVPVDLIVEFGCCQEVLACLLKPDTQSSDCFRLAPSKWACRASPSRHWKFDSCHALWCLIGPTFPAACVLSFPPTPQPSFISSDYTA
jgi:hypothetical protein